LTPAAGDDRLQPSILRGEDADFRELHLREKLRKNEALFAGAGTVGERDAADAALQRVRARLAEIEHKNLPVEMQFSLGDQWSRKLFLALCRRHGLKPYRLYRQRVTTVMLKVPRVFIDQVLWPEFQGLDAALSHYLDYASAIGLDGCRSCGHNDIGAVGGRGSYIRLSGWALS